MSSRRKSIVTDREKEQIMLIINFGITHMGWSEKKAKTLIKNCMKQLKELKSCDFSSLSEKKKNFIRNTQDEILEYSSQKFGWSKTETKNMMKISSRKYKETMKLLRKSCENKSSSRKKK